jgi:hypothetical protein
VQEESGKHVWLVVEPYPSEKYEFVSWDDSSIPNQTGFFPDFPYLHGHLMTRLSLQRGWF